MKEITKKTIVYDIFPLLFFVIGVFFISLAWEINYKFQIINTMANKRSFKKRLNKFSSNLFAECMAAYWVVQDGDMEQLDDIMATILMTHNEFVKRVSYPEPGMKKKNYYRFLWNEFKKHSVEISDNINALE